jgi:hypothetical protein
MWGSQRWKDVGSQGGKVVRAFGDFVEQAMCRAGAPNFIVGHDVIALVFGGGDGVQVWLGPCRLNHIMVRAFFR